MLCESPSIGVLVNLLRESSGVGIADQPVKFLLVSKLVSPLRALIDSKTWPHVGPQLIVDTPPGSKVIYPELVVSPLQATLAVPPSGSCPKFLPHTSDT